MTIVTDDKPIRLLIAETDDAVRQALAAVFWWVNDVEVVGLAADGVEGVRLAEELHPHVVLMDLDVPRLKAVDATRWISTLLPGVSVVGLSTHNDEAAARMVLAAGAADCIPKLARLDELLRAVRVAAGR